MAVSLHPIQTATTVPAPVPIPAPTTTQTPQSPASRPSTADSSLKSPTSATIPAGGAQEKRKTSRRANTAERRATHNAVERQRRETLNGRFLDLASLLPNLTSVRRPSKSAIVNSSIALIHQSRRQKSLASLELRALYTQFLALKAEADEWRARAGVNPVEEGERSREFWEMIREGEEVLKSGMGAGEGGGGGMKEAMRRVREVGEEEGRARVLAEAASSTSHGARRDLNDEDDEDLGMEEEHSPEPPATVVPVPASVAALAAVQHQQQQQMNAAHLAHQQHLAQVHAAAQAQLVQQQQVQQQQQQAQQQMMMRARAASINTVPQQQAQFAYGLPGQHVPQVQHHHHHQVHVPQVQVVPHMYHQQQQQQQQVQIPFDSGADLFPATTEYSSSNLFDNKSSVNEWVNFATSAMASSPPMYEDSASSSGGSSPSPVVGVVRSRSGSLTTAAATGGMPVAAGFY